MALRVPLERAKPEGGKRVEEEAPGFIPPCAPCLAPLSFRSIGHALPPSLLLHTPNKHSSAYFRARNQNRVSCCHGAHSPSPHLGRACQRQGWRSMLSNLKRFAQQQAFSSTRRGSMFTTPGKFYPTKIQIEFLCYHKHNVMLIAISLCTVCV